jgi:hypothetical protein
MKTPTITEEELTAAQQEFFASVRALQMAEGQEQTTCDTCGRNAATKREILPRVDPFAAYTEAKLRPGHTLIKLRGDLAVLRIAVKFGVTREELLDAIRVLQFTAGGL